MSNKKLFKVLWISKMNNGTVVQHSSVYAKNITGACKQVERRDTCTAILAAQMRTGPRMTDKKVETLKQYELLKQ